MILESLMLLFKNINISKLKTKNIFQKIKFISLMFLAVFLISCGDPTGYPASISSSTPEPTLTSIRSRQAVSADYPVTEAAAARFLMRATFGPTKDDIDNLMETGYSIWIQNQLSLPLTTYVSEMLADPSTQSDTTTAGGSAILFWRKAIQADDQLRQRVAFALSEIMVTSVFNGALGNRGHMIATYMDIIQEGAFENFRETMESVTYSPTMGLYLTYIGNQAFNSDTGVVPDENYARELMQLFTIGLLQLNRDGSRQLDGAGNVIEVYDNSDITELAKVFTGLWWSGLDFRRGSVQEKHEVLPMEMNNQFHSTEQKEFLGLSIPANTSGEKSIDLALDHLFMHQNTAPFITKQLIQRLVTSNPSTDYVERVVSVFESGSYQLPNGQIIGSAQRGHFAPLIAAILLDPEALDSSTVNNPQFGKIREPVIRFTHWARAFAADLTNSEMRASLTNTSSSTALSQQAYRSPSVFNFFRPGYVAPGTLTAEAGLVAPELQITHASSVIGYINFVDTFIKQTRGSLTADYSTEIELVSNPELLAEHLNLILMAGRMRLETRARIIAAINSVSDDNEFSKHTTQVQAAISIAMSSSEFLVQL